MDTENSNQISKRELKYQDEKNITSNRYMIDTRKHYLLAANTDSLDTLLSNQKEQLNHVLMQLKSEYDLVTRESAIKSRLIEEYNKKINNMQKSDTKKEKKQEEKKEKSKLMKNGIEIKKNTINEEIYNKKTLTKQVEKLTNDLLLIHKQIVQNENESKLLDKQKERMKLDENIIKETKNQIQYKINEQKLLNKRNKSENDLQLLYYETVIKQKSMFMEFSDERKARQIKIEQQAKIDSHDKQEVDKRRKYMLLLLYNQYLKQRMENQLKKYEELEYIYQKIKDLTGTDDLTMIIKFVLLRNKRYNYNMHIVDEKQNKINKLKKEIKSLKSRLTKLKNEVIINENEKNNSKIETLLQEQNGLNNKDINMIKIENEKNQQLRVLGEQYNEVNLSYNRVLENIKEMQEYDQNHPLDLKEKEEEEKKEEQENIGNKNEDFQLTAEEEECINGYEKFLEKILKAFNILCLCKSKQEFLSLMREKGIAQQTDNKTTLNKTIGKARRHTRKSLLKTTKIKVEEPVKNNEGDEEEDLSNYEMDKNILTRFMKEQKKEIDEFINVKKGEVRKPPANK
jgi:hypothetical protein